ncbi:MAG: nucleotidyltransferase domain-containing protein [Nitrospirae bacterium]|nr:nucleotidyltransferase domain-containing protein [Nitrospirota bacterium]
MIKFERLPADILSRILEGKKILVKDDNVIFVYIFGGLAEGDAKPLSDIDIAVYLRDTSNLVEYKLQLFDKLTDALGTSELDLIILNTAPISLTGRILQKKQTLVDKEPPIRHAYESITLREFFDFKVKEDAFFARRYGVGR